ncbi:phytanoyl-CoA dioxygenase family protein [Paenibacillus humicola]|uniref:phytanoyl-CoA dioxygenase family protein n=1 Tax=Paenibacillus humicola TaxID=3110540 RepID=UPI00237A9A5E|nr:phytanoyl-CoA dioxygenase family protein [Paenibacillus humicola]
MNEAVKLEKACTDMEEYLFDLRGYLILENALTPEQLAACNATYDELEQFGSRLEEPIGWMGNVRVRKNTGQQELFLSQLYEAGPVWEELIDHPSWFEKVKHFIGTDDPQNFDGHHGPMFIDENFGTIRGKDGAIRLHSGGDVGTIRTQFRYHAGKFHCGQINILMALTDIGPGDGATMVVPGSHKSNIRHPQAVNIGDENKQYSSVDDVEGAIECHLKAGDALMFVDAIAHGSARRVNEGNRRIAVYRYGPSWGFFRGPLWPSDELLERTTPQRRQILMPHPIPQRPPQR